MSKTEYTDNTVYRVETTWPGGNDEEKFSCYGKTTYTSADDPGINDKWLLRSHPELFKNLAGADSCIFSDFDSARKLALFLIEKGRVSAGWEGREVWREKYRGALKVRVVRVRTQKQTEILDNLRPRDPEIEKFIAGVSGAVEADGYARHSLWQDWHYEPKYKRKLTWVSETMGMCPVIGHVDDRPVTLSMFISIINDKRILFWDSPSQVVDHKMIDEWLEDYLPGIPRTDANNFHNILR